MPSRSKPNQALVLLTIGLALIGVVLALAYGYANGWSDTFDAIYEHAVPTIIHASITAYLGGIVIHQLLKHDELKAIEDSIRQTLLSDTDVIHRYSQEQKVQMVERFVKAAVPGTHGERLYEAMVKPYVNSYSFRSDYRYRIQFALDAKRFNGQTRRELLNFTTDRYHWVTSSLKFSKAVSAYPEQIRIAFADGQEELETLIGNSEIFFREGLFLEPDAWGTIREFDPVTLRLFVNNLLNLKLKVNREPARLTSIKHGQGKHPALELVFEIPQASKTRVDTTLFELTFEMPYRRSVEWFLATLPEPTDSPEFTFVSGPQQKDLAAITFLTRHEHDEDLHSVAVPNGWTVSLKNCAFPRSGVMFVWNDR